MQATPVPRQRCNTAQIALDHAVAMELSISDALASCGIPRGAYFIQVGFNEDMILLGKGAVQEIYIHINFEIPGDASPVLNELGQVLSPFPSMLLTPTTPHQIPIFSKEGIPLHETEFWALIEDRGIFRRDLSMRDEGVPHNIAAQDGEMREGGGHDHQVAEVNKGAWADGVSSALQCSDNTGGDIAKETGSCGSSGSSGSGSAGSDRGGTGFQGGDGRREEGSSGSPDGGRFPGGGGPPDDGGDGGGDDSGSSLDEPDHGPHIGELSIPLSAILDVEWEQDPRISQRFSTTSKIDTTVWLGPFRTDFY
jgi:hypothetical protein